MCWVAGASRVVQCLPGCRGQSGRCTAAAGLACASPFCAHAAKCPNDPAGPCWPDRKPAVTDCSPASVHDLSCLPAHSPRRAFLLYAKANTAQRRASRAARNSLAHPLLHRHALCPPPHQSVLARLAKRARSSRAPPKLKGAWSACSCASTRESPGAPLAAAAVTATFHSLQHFSPLPHFCSRPLAGLAVSPAAHSDEARGGDSLDGRLAHIPGPAAHIPLGCGRPPAVGPPAPVWCGGPLAGLRAHQLGAVVPEPPVNSAAGGSTAAGCARGAAVCAGCRRRRPRGSCHCAGTGGSGRCRG